ncbi:MAG: hydrolase [Chloroherpetonaceae bacterium]|nr:hydrolase [Chloroherpetonaceae bacterium]MCS7210806.1 hydrolase [Chloroherpetonaceae bacterium]MDW8019647.1 hydrolase [Chloroherpetonaceae bacterium]MDW8467150.1 hydrolase [Chloroherpetonaceae bacterium]
MLEQSQTALIVIDVQGKLATLMHDRETLFANLRRLIQGAKLLGIPIVLTEQYPQGLGETAPELKALMPDVSPITKMSFSCCGEVRFLDALRALQRRQMLVAGIESHICVYQTVRDLLREGYEVEVVADAVSSRSAENRALGLSRMKDMGATLTSTEMSLFELLREAGTPVFKEISKLVK